MFGAAPVPPSGGAGGGPFQQPATGMHGGSEHPSRAKSLLFLGRRPCGKQ